MTPQENQLLNDLIRRVRETKLTEKDPEAEQLLRDGLASQPDAIYILAQTALVQNIALEQAGSQIEQLKQQLQQAQQQAQRPARATSFLSGLLGHRDEPEQAPAAQIPQQQRPGFAGQPQYQQQPQYQPVAVPAGGYAGQPAPPMSGGGGSSFLRSAATTAAGVAAGALAFEGIQALFHGMSHPSGFGYGSGFGGFGSPIGMGGGFGSAPVEETVINNYYDSSDPNREHHEHEASFDERPEGHEQLDRSEYEPDRNSAHLENASYDPAGDSNVQDDDFQDQDDLQDEDDGMDDLADDSGDFSGGDDSSFV